MRYCPNPACPHRLLAGTAAEFLEHVSVCSDCAATLVEEAELASAEAAFANPAPRDPYRGPNVPKVTRPAAAATAGRFTAATGYLLIGGSLLVMGVTCALVPPGGASVIAVGPALLGAYLLLRSPTRRQ